MTDVRRILIVDDETGFREMLGWNLADDGVDVDTAENGEEAVKALSQREYALLLTDITMPRVDGMRLLSEAKRLRPGMPVILMTGFGTVEAAVEAMKKGAADFVLKPFDLPGMVTRVRSLLGLPIRAAAAPPKGV